MTPSPRTADLPMAFTFGEFVRGAFAAYGWFLLLAVGATVLSFLTMAPVAFVMALFYDVPWGAAALVVGSPLAWALGMLLRRVRRRAWHLLAFAALGMLIGTGTTLIAMRFLGYDEGALTLLVVLHVAAATAALPLGWRFTVRRALGGDGAVAARVPRRDLDAQYEDRF